MNDGKVRRKVRHLQATLLQVPTWIHPGIAQGLVFMAPVAAVQMLNLWETSGISDCWDLLHKKITRYACLSDEERSVICTVGRQHTDIIYIYIITVALEWNLPNPFKFRM